MSFTDEEIAYMRSQPLARVATVGADGQPDTVPLAFEFDGTYFWVGGPGAAVTGTRKFRNVAAGNGRVALVIDDLVSLDPFIARGVRVYGEAGAPSNAPAWSAPASTCASPRRSRGAGTWTASRPATPGTRPAAPSTSPDRCEMRRTLHQPG